MRGLRNQIAIQHPEALFMLSTCNQDNTEEDIFVMGEKLAKEVKQHVIEFCPGNTLSRLSFAGFSLGGLITRAALPHLECYKSKMWTFLSMGAPHLGYMYNSNKLFETGMWFLRKWKKSKALAQLSMTDASNPEETAIFKLSMAPGLDWFANVILVCSNQDSYVPFDSARIQICKEALTDVNGTDSGGNRGNLYIQMSWNLLSKLSTKLIYRIDADF